MTRSQTPRHLPRLRPALLAAALASTQGLPAAAEVAAAEAELVNADGGSVGTAELRETPAGVLLHLRLQAVPPGVHGLHIHETGRCEPPFQSAGGHLMAPGTAHGYLSQDGPHLGDMPNIHVPDSGALELEVLTGITDVESQLLDQDRAALLIHQGADDYHSQPAGAAGPRIACGVIQPKGR